MQQYSAGEVVALVERLYSAQEPSAIADLQSQLQAIQKSAHGWDVAELLLSQSSVNCQFIGALTYTVNLNIHATSLAAPDSPVTYGSVMTKLLGHLRAIAEADPGLKSHGLTLKKILANLALIYTRTFEAWQDPLQTLVSYLTGQNAMDNLNPRVVAILLLFSQIIVEDLTKKDSSSKRAELHKSVHERLYPATPFGLQGLNGVATAWLDCCSAWIQYISVAELESTERYDASEMLSRLFQLLVDSKGETRVIAVITDIFDTNPGMMNPTLKNTLDSLLFGNWGTGYLNEHGDDQETVNMFSRLVIRFLEGNLVNFAASLYHDETDRKYQFLLQLTNFPGTPVVDEMNSVDFVDFWAQLAECFESDMEWISLLLKNDETMIAKLHEKSMGVFSQAAQIYWQKVHVPEDVSELEGSREEFDSFRRDVADFFEAIYPIVRFPLFGNLVDSIINGIGSGCSLSNIEASLFLMKAVSSNFSEHSVEDDVMNALVRVMNSDLLKVVQESIGYGQTVQYPIHTTIQFLSSIDYFYRHATGVPYLSTILNFLFGCMLNANNYSLIASKAISKICDECRQFLVDFIPYFDDLLAEMVTNYEVEPLIRQRIINSYASIVQGIRNPEAQSQYLYKILSLIQERSVVAITEFSGFQGTAEQREKLFVYLISLLSSVKEIGRGMKLPDDVDQIYKDEEIKVIDEFWKRDPMGIHQVIIDTVSAFAIDSPILSKSLRVMQEACYILQSGMSESVGGPFVFEDCVPLHFMEARCRHKQADPKAFFDTLPSAFSLLSALINSSFRTLTPEQINKIVDVLILQNMGEISVDPDLLQGTLTSLTTIIEKRPALLVHQLMFSEKLLPFAVSQLRSKERYVLKAAEKFWVRLGGLRRGDKQDTITVQRLFLETPLGETLMYTALASMLESPRSNVDLYIEVIKVIVVKYQKMAKQWMIAAFARIDQERASQGKQPVANSQVFVSKVLVTRGMGGCNRVINDLWLQVNGLVNYSSQ